MLAMSDKIHYLSMMIDLRRNWVEISKTDLYHGEGFDYHDVMVPIEICYENNLTFVRYTLVGSFTKAAVAHYWAHEWDEASASHTSYLFQVKMTEFKS